MRLFLFYYTLSLLCVLNDISFMLLVFVLLFASIAALCAFYTLCIVCGIFVSLKLLLLCFYLSFVVSLLYYTNSLFVLCRFSDYVLFYTRKRQIGFLHFSVATFYHIPDSKLLWTNRKSV